MKARILELREEHGWPAVAAGEHPTPPKGVPTVKVARPNAEQQEGAGLKVFHSSFAQLGSKEGKFWQEASEYARFQDRATMFEPPGGDLEKLCKSFVHLGKLKSYQ